MSHTEQLDELESIGDQLQLLVTAQAEQLAQTQYIQRLLQNAIRLLLQKAKEQSTITNKDDETETDDDSAEEENLQQRAERSFGKKRKQPCNTAAEKESNKVTKESTPKPRFCAQCEAPISEKKSCNCLGCHKKYGGGKAEFHEFDCKACKYARNNRCKGCRFYVSCEGCNPHHDDYDQEKQDGANVGPGRGNSGKGLGKLPKVSQNDFIESVDRVKKAP